nr:PTS sugar transporter subunit IIC [Spiroplasma clarkii]
MGMLKPMFSGLVIGLILGNVELGLIAGGTFDLAYLGFGRAGGANPPSNAAPAIFGVIWVVTLGMDIQVALSLTFPLAVFIAFMNTFIFSIMAPTSKIVEPAIRAKNKLGYYFLANSTLFVLFIWGFLLALLLVTHLMVLMKQFKVYHNDWWMFLKLVVTYYLELDLQLF